MSALKLSWRMLLRDLRSGTLTVLALALMLAVAALTGVGFLADRVQRAIETEAHQLLGGDLLLTADHPWRDVFRHEARQRGLRLAESASFPSMVASGEGVQLAEIKAVSRDYPLRGAMRVAPRLNAPDAATQDIPGFGQVWIDARLAAGLGIDVQAKVKVGAGETAVSGIVTFEPDRGINPFSIAPRLVMPLDGLAATGLVQPGSRIAWRLHLAGEAVAVAGFRRWAEGQLGRGERIEGLDNARPEIRTLLERAERFLRLAALLTVVLAAVAAGLAAQRYMALHLDACAVMRCIGASERHLLLIHGGEFMLLGLLATLIGILAGLGVQAALHGLLAGLVASELPAPSMLPALQGLAVGLVLVAGFVLPPLLRLKSVPTVRVLRREWGESAPLTLASYVAGLGGLGALMLWMAGDLRLGGMVLGGFVLAILAFALLGRGFVALAGRLAARGLTGSARWGLANLSRRTLSTLVQLVALALGLTALLLLTATRGDLLAAWRARLPADAPNRFVINIQPGQREDVAAFFRREGLPVPELEPMVRGRLTRVNGRAVGPQDYQDDRARRLVEREFNLSERDTLPAENRIVAGRWHEPGSVLQFSVEKGLAETLHLHIGDELRYEIAGEPLAGRITSLRKLDWDSMRVNFFVISPAGSLAGQPTSYITSFHLPPGHETRLDRLVRQFPNLTVIDVASLVRQLQETLDQVARAVQLVFALALLAGGVVLIAALQAGMAERHHEIAVLRALGGRQRQLRGALMIEHAALGGLAGLMAGIAAAGLGTALARGVFHLDYWPSPMLLPIGMLCGAAGVLGIGMATLRSASRQTIASGLRSI